MFDSCDAPELPSLAEERPNPSSVQFSCFTACARLLPSWLALVDTSSRLYQRATRLPSLFASRAGSAAFTCVALYTLLIAQAACFSCTDASWVVSRWRCMCPDLGTCWRLGFSQWRYACHIGPAGKSLAPAFVRCFFVV